MYLIIEQFIAGRPCQDEGEKSRPYASRVWAPLYYVNQLGYNFKNLESCKNGEQYLNSFTDTYEKLCLTLCPIDCIKDEYLIIMVHQGGVGRMQPPWKKFFGKNLKGETR